MTEKKDNSPAVDAEENEIVSATRESQAQKAAADASEADEKGVAQKSGIGWKKAAGIGIGSAAVLAALLFVNRDKR